MCGDTYTHANSTKIIIFNVFEQYPNHIPCDEFKIVIIILKLLKCQREWIDQSRRKKIVIWLEFYYRILDDKLFFYYFEIIITEFKFAMLLFHVSH